MIVRLVALIGLLALSAVSSAQSVRYVHSDALGSPVAITDSGGQILERREYEPYGAQLLPGLRDGPGYTGHVQDAATGLTYMQQRYYDPSLGQFLSVDPVTVLTKGDLRHFNRYAYAYNNPYKFTDPDGRQGEFVAFRIILGVAAADAATPDPTDAAAPGKAAVYASGLAGAAIGGAIVWASNKAYDSIVQNNESAEGDNASGDDLDRNPKDDQRLSGGEVKQLDKAGHDVHEIKGGKNASKKDLFKDKKGNVYVKPKDGSGPGEPTGINLRDID